MCGGEGTNARMSIRRFTRLTGGIAVTDAQLATVHLKRHPFHGDWNYTIDPATSRAKKSVIV
jgi:hypothetical protein